LHHDWGGCIHAVWCLRLMCIHTSNDRSQLPGLEGTEYCASFNLRKAARAVTQLFDSGLEPTGIRSTQFTLLVAVAKSTPISMGHLARILVIDRTTLTRSLRVLQRQGFLSISERSTMRQRFVTLSPKGWTALERSLPRWREVQDSFVARIGQRYWEEMQREIQKLSKIAIELGKSSCGSPSEPGG
jgi:DNA-binding MarR family transcriptional regulator